MTDGPDDKSSRVSVYLVSPNMRKTCLPDLRKEPIWHPTPNTHTKLYLVETAIPNSFPNLSGIHGGPLMVTHYPSATRKFPHTHSGDTLETARLEVPRAADDLHEHSPPSTSNYTHFRGPPVETSIRTAPHTLSNTQWHGPPLETLSRLPVAPGPVMATNISIASGPLSYDAHEESWSYSQNLAEASKTTRTQEVEISIPHSIHAYVTVSSCSKPIVIMEKFY